jgi:hypothetical protein
MSVTATELLVLEPIGTVSSHHTIEVQRGTPTNNHDATALKSTLSNRDDELGVPLAPDTAVPAWTRSVVLTILQPSIINFFSSFTNGIRY